MQTRFLLVIPLVVVILGGLYISASSLGASGKIEYSSAVQGSRLLSPATPTGTSAKNSLATTTPPKIIVTHVPTPRSVKAIYMTSWVASTKDWRADLVKFIDTTEINAIVIDIKDDAGRIAYPVEDPILKASGAEQIRVKDMKAFIADLHQRNIYVIGRVAVFQDAYMVKQKPEWAVKRASDGAVWRDRKGIPWVDAGNPEASLYAVRIGKDAHSVGFDEINYDYIRFPSDGNMKDIAYPFSEGKIKHEVLRNFFASLRKAFDGTGIVISADLFGMTTTNTDDLGIGQVLEDALLYFDYVAPMVYPSHYPPGFNGWKNPNTVPYEIIKFSMSRAVERANVLEKKESGYVASSTTPPFVTTGKYKNKLRPWIQDFDYGGNYGPTEVRAQITATYDSGLSSFMVWDPGNKYTRAAFYKVEPDAPSSSRAGSTTPP